MPPGRSRPPRRSGPCAIGALPSSPPPRSRSRSSSPCSCRIADERRDPRHETFARPRVLPGAVHPGSLESARHAEPRLRVGYRTGAFGSLPGPEGPRRRRSPAPRAVQLSSLRGGRHRRRRRTARGGSRGRQGVRSRRLDVQVLACLAVRGPRGWLLLARPAPGGGAPRRIDPAIPRSLVRAALPPRVRLGASRGARLAVRGRVPQGRRNRRDPLARAHPARDPRPQGGRGGAGGRARGPRRAPRVAAAQAGERRSGRGGDRRRRRVPPARAAANGFVCCPRPRSCFGRRLPLTVKAKGSSVAEERAERTCLVRNKMGLHARPAALIVQTANKFPCDVILLKDGQEVNAKSIMGVLMLAAAKGSEILVRAEGEQASACVDAIDQLFLKGFNEAM